MVQFAVAQQTTFRLGNAEPLPESDFLDKAAAGVVTITVETPVGAQITSPDLNLSQTITRQGLGFFVASADNGALALVPADLVIGSKSITLTLTDGRKLNADVYAYDEITNLALIRTVGQNFTVLRWGSSDALTPNSWGAAFSTDKLIVGAIDGTPRVGATAFQRSYRYLPVIQFNAKGTQGVVGSPLINNKGEVVGVLTSVKASPSLAPVNTPKADAIKSIAPPSQGYALPSSYVGYIVRELQTNKKVRHPWVGIIFGDAPNGKGAVVVSVTKNSPSDQVSILPNDIIVSVNKQPISNGIDLAVALTRQQVDSQITIQFRRGKRIMERTLFVKSQTAPKSAE